MQCQAHNLTYILMYFKIMMSQYPFRNQLLNESSYDLTKSGAYYQSC